MMKNNSYSTTEKKKEEMKNMSTETEEINNMTTEKKTAMKTLNWIADQCGISSKLMEAARWRLQELMDGLERDEYERYVYPFIALVNVGVDVEKLKSVARKVKKCRCTDSPL